jgi:hypothetical protein
VLLQIKKQPFRFFAVGSHLPYCSSPRNQNTHAHDYRGNHTAKSRDGRIPIDTVLPVVVLRDPYSWMQSMCRTKYNAHWDHSSEEGECPNLVPTANNINSHPVKYRDLQYVPVTVDYDRKKNRVTKHASLVHLYNEWYQGYVNATTFPRLVVRMEDLIFRGEETIAQICECGGGTAAHERYTQKQNTVKIGKNTVKGTESTGFWAVIAKYGNASNRRVGFLPNQLQAAKELLDPKLMQTFGYLYENP